MMLTETRLRAGAAGRAGFATRMIVKHLQRALRAEALAMAGTALLMAISFANRAQATNYALSAVGAQKIYAGYNGYVAVTALFDGPGANLYFNGISAPDGLTYELSCLNGTHPCWLDNGTNRKYVYGDDPRYSEVPFLLRVAASPDTVPGTYTVTVATEATGIQHSFDIPIEVLPAPAFTPAPPAYSPPIPGLKKWEATMQSLGKKWCQAGKVYGFGWEADVWYYDGARVYFQLADYTGDRSWEGCAYNIARQYRDAVLQASNGWGQGWRVFPHGLRMAYERSGDESYKQALMLLATKSAFASTGGRASNDFSRETSYIVETYIQAEKLGAPRDPHLATGVDYLLGNLENILEDRNYTLHQTFMDGLMAEALIEYYELTNDPRIPPAIKTLLDWTWTTAWDNHAKQLVYNPDSIPRQYFTELNNLIAPAFAWYYSVTGDERYQRRGDELFAHALDTDIGWSGKIYSQNYRWSFAYVDWRRPSNEAISVSLPEWLASEQTVNTEVLLSAPAAGPCGEQVLLASSDESVLQVPKVVVLRSGDVAANVALATGKASSEQTVDISTSFRSNCGAEPVSRTTAVSVVPTRLRVVLSTDVQNGGTFCNNRVFLDGAPAGSERTIKLSSDRPDLVKFAYNGAAITSIDIAPGKAESDYFLMTTGYVSDPTTVTITAQSGELLASVPLQIRPPEFRVSLVGGGLVTGGGKVSLSEVVLNAPAPEGGKTVKLRSSLPGTLDVPANITVPEGALSASFSYGTAVVPSLTPVDVTASCDDKVAKGLVQVNSLALSFYILHSPLTSGRTTTDSVILSAEAPADLTVSLTASDTAALTVPASTVIPKGSRKGEFTVTAGKVTTATTVTITAQLGGLTAKATTVVNP